jgi:hypothetical protein
LIARGGNLVERAPIKSAAIAMTTRCQRQYTPSLKFVLTERVAFVLIYRGGRHLRPQHLLGELLQQLTEGPPVERSIRDAASIVLAVAQHPGLADRAVARQRLREQAGQLPTAPRPVLIDRFEPQGYRGT